jgi:CheY-like chemotaxis protein
MLVEDDNSLREIYKARLLAEGYEIATAQDGEEALSIVGQEKPDLIVLDVMMPKISGFDTLDILRSTPATRDTKVIMMTALSQAEDKARAEKLGANRYLVKSQVTLEDIVKSVKEVLGEDSKGGTLSQSTTPASPTTATSVPAIPTAAPAAIPDPVKKPVQPTEPSSPALGAIPDPADGASVTGDLKIEDLDLDPAPATAAIETAAAPAPAVPEPPTAPATTSSIQTDGTKAADLAEPAAEEEAQVDGEIKNLLANSDTFKPPADADTPSEPAEIEVTSDAGIPPQTFNGNVVGDTAVLAASPASAPPTAADELVASAPDPDMLPGPDPLPGSSEPVAPADSTLASGLIPTPPSSEPVAPADPIPVSEPTPEAPAPAPAPTPLAPPTPITVSDGDNPDDSDDNEPENHEATGGNRVIEPLHDLAHKKPDINALLAKEAADESVASAPAPAPAPTPLAPPTPPTNNEKSAL